MSQVSRVTYNWHVRVIDGLSQECVHEYRVGEDGVRDIREIYPRFEGDAWVCTVYFDDGRMLRVANINTIEYATKISEPVAFEV